MDPIFYQPFTFPDFGSTFLPWRLWQGHIDWIKPGGLDSWAAAPFIVGVA